MVVVHVNGCQFEISRAVQKLFIKYIDMMSEFVEFLISICQSCSNVKLLFNWIVLELANLCKLFLRENRVK